MPDQRIVGRGERNLHPDVDRQLGQRARALRDAPGHLQQLHARFVHGLPAALVALGMGGREVLAAVEFLVLHAETRQPDGRRPQPLGPQVHADPLSRVDPRRQVDEGLGMRPHSPPTCRAVRPLHGEAGSRVEHERHVQPVEGTRSEEILGIEQIR